MTPTLNRDYRRSSRGLVCTLSPAQHLGRFEACSYTLFLVFPTGPSQMDSAWPTQMRRVRIRVGAWPAQVEKVVEEALKLGLPGS